MSQTLIAETYRSNPELAERASEQMQGVLTRSATDMEFRSLLLSDSHTALGQHFGRPVTGDISIAFVESKASATFVLPDAVQYSDELAEGELESVAGGVSVTPVEWIAFGVALYLLGDVLT